jgi:transcription antitermination factor NusA-like protein
MVTWMLTLALAADPPVDRACTALLEKLTALSPVVRKGRVEVVACARVAGERAVVVVRSARGVVGDPLDLMGSIDSTKLRPLAAALPDEDLVLAADRGDPAALVRDAIAPVKAEAIVVRPGALSVDLVVEPAPAPGATWLRLASIATGLELRVFTPGAWTMARVRSRELLLEQLPVSEEDVDRLISAGVLTSDDVASLPGDALAGVVGGDLARAQSLADAAAWFAEYEASPDGRRRGW